MSGVRLAVFSKYFAAGVTISVLCCGRHFNYLNAQISHDLKEHYSSVARYAEQVSALELSFLENNKEKTKEISTLKEKELRNIIINNNESFVVGGDGVIGSMGG